MLVSLLIANYNNGSFFKDCFDSILAQSYSNWEVIVVDDCSSDESLKIIQQIVKGDHRVRICSNDINMGVGHTKNRAVHESSGELCAFLDPDDSIEPDAIQKMVAVFQSNPSLVLVHSSFNICNDRLQQIGKYEQAKPVDSKDPYFLNLDGSITHFAMFSREAYLSSTGIDTYMKRAVDQDLYLKLCEAGETSFLDAFLYNYRVHEGGISTGVTGQNALKALYWHWYACNQAAKRRNIVVEDIFLKQFVLRTELEACRLQINQPESMKQLLKKITQKFINKLPLLKAK